MRATAKDKSLRRIGQDPERRRHAGGFGGSSPRLARGRATAKLAISQRAC